MRFSRVLAILLLLSPNGARAAMQISTGVGFEARSSNDVNSQFVSAGGLGALYISGAFHPWSALWEVNGQPSQQTSSTGNYRVSSQMFSTMLWGRYEPWSTFQWSPYFGLGGGQSFIEVKTQFGSASDDRWTDGGLAAGLAGGVMTTLWRHWNIESEIRILKQEFAANPNFGFALRTGLTF